MRNVLVIAYYFPPMGLSGVQRTLKFVKYLPQFHWKPTVLTVTPSGYFAKDESLLNELKGIDVNIVRTTSIDPTRIFARKNSEAPVVIQLPSEPVRKLLSITSQIFFIPDNKIGWKQIALKQAAALFDKEKFELIFATAPPYSDLLIGEVLKRWYGVPLVLDYRDAWLDNPRNFYLTPLHRYLHYRLEKRVLRRSDKVIAINRRIKELLLKRYPFLHYQDVEIIPQGFDPADFRLDGRAKLPHTNKMRITYAGVFYDKQTPKYFLHALANVFKQHPQLRGRIEACFIGLFQQGNKKLINKLGLQNDVNIVGYVDHAECIKYLMSSDVLWLMIGKARGHEMISTGKLYEYIGSKKPILGCVPEGIAKATLLESESGIVVDPNDVKRIEEAIKTLYDQYKSHRLQNPSEEFVEKYNRIALTAQLAKVFESVTT